MTTTTHLIRQCCVPVKDKLSLKEVIVGAAIKGGHVGVINGAARAEAVNILHSQLVGEGVMVDNSYREIRNIL